jgi:hypothetical protein
VRANPTPFLAQSLYRGHNVGRLLTDVMNTGSVVVHEIFRRSAIGASGNRLDNHKDNTCVALADPLFSFAIALTTSVFIPLYS